MNKRQQLIVSCVCILFTLLITNTIAMKVLLSNTAVPLGNSFTTIGGIYINPLSFIKLYQQYESIAVNLFRIPSSIYFLGFCICVAIPILINKIGGKTELTSEGTAKWATYRNVKKHKSLIDPMDDTATGIIVGSWTTGLISYETAFDTCKKVQSLCKLSDNTFWKLLQVVQVVCCIARWYIVDNGDTHSIMVAPSRSGKGIGIILPTLWFWKGATIVSDLKRENIAKTGAFRKYVLGHKVIEFAPTDTRKTYRFNPINEIRWGTPNEGKDVGNVITLLVGAPEGTDAHWKANAISLITGALVYLKYYHAKINNMKGLTPDDTGYIETNMYHVYEFLSVSVDNDGDPISLKEKLENLLVKEEQFPTSMYVYNKTSELPKLYINISIEKAQEIITFTEEAKKTPTKHPVVVANFNNFISKPDNEAGSVLSTAITALSMFSEKIIADNTATSDFVLGDIRELSKPSDLFLVVPPSDLDRVRGLFSLIFELSIQRYTEDEAYSKTLHKCLILLDEWPAFGKMETLVTELGYIASYGMRVLLICQGLDQVKAIYKSLKFTSNCETQIYLAPRDELTPKFLSEKLGKQTILIEQESSNGKSLFEPKNKTKIEKGRLLLDPAEVSRLGNDSVIILSGLENPIRTPKNKWFKCKDMVDKFELGQSLDTDQSIGLRPIDAKDLASLENIPWCDYNEQETLETVLSDIIPNDVQNDVREAILAFIRCQFMCTLIENQKQGLTILDSAYKTVTLFDIYDMVRISTVPILKDTVHDYWNEFKPYLHDECVLMQYTNMMNFIDALTDTSFKVLQFKILQALQTFK